MNSFLLSWWKMHVHHRGRAILSWGSWQPAHRQRMRGCKSWWVASLSFRIVLGTLLFSIHLCTLLSETSLHTFIPTVKDGQHMAVINPLPSPLGKTTRKHVLSLASLFTQQNLSNCPFWKHFLHVGLIRSLKMEFKSLHQLIINNVLVGKS